MALPPWDPPKRILPSELHRGENDKDTIHLAVGRALDEWEKLESVMAFIFGQLIESNSAAGRHAYGTLIAGAARRDILEAATWQFFRYKNSDTAMLDLVELYAAYGGTAQYRNNIAHGICYSFIVTERGGPLATGWFLCPPQYNTRRQSSIDAKSSYFYKSEDIYHCMTRFSQIINEADELELYLREHYPLL